MRKMSWLISMVAVAAAAVATTRLVGASSAGSSSDAAERVALLARLERLEARATSDNRATAAAGARLGAAVFNASASAAPAAVESDDDQTPAGQARASERAAELAEKEHRHYDGLDALARNGGGGPASLRVRKNIEEVRNRSETGLDIVSLDCSDVLCRVELRVPGSAAAASMIAAQALMPGMGALTQRPHTPGKPAVYYVAAPGKDLPRMPD
jgi:hypothetical protein